MGARTIVAGHAHQVCQLRRKARQLQLAGGPLLSVRLDKALQCVDLPERPPGSDKQAV